MVTVQKCQGPVFCACIASRRPRMASTHIHNDERLDCCPHDPFTLLRRLLSHLKCPGLSMSTVTLTNERLAAVPKLILGLLIGTMAVLDGLFSTLT